MKLDVSFPALEALMRRMGAPEVRWTPGASTLAPLDLAALAGRGIEIDLSEVEPTANGLLTYRGEQVVLYIREPRKNSDRATLLNAPEKGPRFHVADCETLQDMRQKGRFERYVVTNNHSGLFTVIATDARGRPAGEIDAPLKVCKNCLKHLAYKGYGQRGNKAEIWNAFALPEFFQAYESHFRTKPRYTDKTAPPPGYAEDWKRISAKYRASVGWRCEQCGVTLTTHKNLLHTHHRNAVTGDNRWTNLQALCVVCHSEQPGHTMRVTAEERAVVEEKSLGKVQDGRRLPHGGESDLSEA